MGLPSLLIFKTALFLLLCSLSVAVGVLFSSLKPTLSVIAASKQGEGASQDFHRAYALDASGAEAGYGQTTDAKKLANLMEVRGISGRHASIDIAAGYFSAFSVVSLAGFFVLASLPEKVADDSLDLLDHSFGNGEGGRPEEMIGGEDR
ncbi:hypothetical protein QJS10_CPA06g01227 [Acorus calamus]|uniref:Uncharacterized protein n=1 Tax=Acorus calamus TaxID=4465 RepID=A0AAV9EIK5_ACOCL|nr:hypothetical protein QJS10_CPA06g01227 [Acorus calamus]